jgi:hypothetical protein
MTASLCCNCIISVPAVFYGTGAGRCKSCSVRFDHAIYTKRVAEMHAQREADAKHVCGQEIEGATDICVECCDHEYDPDEGMMCTLCGAEYPY